MSTATTDTTRSFAARWIVPIDGKPLENGLISVRSGRIESVTPRRQCRADVDFDSGIILPGLVNAHTHLDLNHCRIIPGQKFTDWLRAVIAYRRSGPDTDCAIADGIGESICHGTTLIGDISAEGRSWEQLSKAPIKSIVFGELLGLSPERSASAWAWARGWLDCQPGKGLSPHAPYSVNRQLFTSVADLPASVPVAIHVAESQAEIDLLANRTGAFVPFLEELGVYYPEGLVGSFDELADCFAGKRVVWVHANYWSERFDPIVYCPRTHAAFGHSPHPFRELLDRGVCVALGTDSRASNPDLSILEEMRFLYRHHPDRATDILRMGTLNGARALGFDAETGSLTPGKRADFVVLSAETSRDPRECVLDGTSKILSVYAGGECIYDASANRDFSSNDGFRVSAS